MVSLDEIKKKPSHERIPYACCSFSRSVTESVCFIKFVIRFDHFEHSSKSTGHLAFDGSENFSLTREVRLFAKRQKESIEKIDV